MGPAHADLLTRALFVFFLSVVVMVMLTDVRNMVLPDASIIFWLVFLTPILTIAAGVIMVHSLILVSQERLLQHLIMSIMSVNVMYIAVFLLFTHPALAFFSPFQPSDEKYRSLAALLGTVIAGSVCASVFSGTNVLTKRGLTVTLISGLIAPAIVFAWFLMSPVPPVVLIVPGTYVHTPIGWGLMISVSVVACLTIIRSLFNWQESRSVLDQNMTMAAILWLCSMYVFVSQSADAQITGALWFAVLIAGFVILDVGAIIAAVIQPLGQLERMVTEKTREARRLQQESEFYLNMWSHEVGNLLQGIVHYLEIMQMHDQIEPARLRELDISAMSLANKATLITRQVSTLKEVKELADRTPRPVELSEAIRRGIMTAAGMVGDGVFETTVHSDIIDARVLADDLLELVFLNIICHAVESSKTTPVLIRIGIERNGTFVRVSISYKGRTLSNGTQQSLLEYLDPSTTLLGVDLFTVKLLLDRYSASMAYYGDEQTEDNRFELRFRKTN